MQTEVPTLPVVHSSVHKSPIRKKDGYVQNSSTDNESLSLYKGMIQLPSNRKLLHPLLEEVYQNGKKHSYLNKKKTSAIEQRVTSAKMLHIKQLQNQLADAHYHLNELATENRLLKALQKKQELALKRYEGTNAELPKIISSHQEELRVLRARYTKLKNTHKGTCELLKEKESELHSLQIQNKHLTQLSKDRNLKEREKLQAEVVELNHIIQQHQDTIQSLHKRISLESKSLKQQLQTEISKHKETQSNLQKTIEKLKVLENLVDCREQRMSYKRQLHSTNVRKSVGSQSLTNIKGTSTTLNFEKPQSGQQRVQSYTQKDSLPILKSLPSSENENRKTNCGHNLDESLCLKSETMATLQQVRKFKLQRPFEVVENHSDKHEGESNLHYTARRFSFGCKYDSLGDIPKCQKDLNHEKSDICIDTESDIINREGGMYKLPSDLKLQYGYTSSDTEEEGEISDQLKEGAIFRECTKNSQKLHATLINGDDDNLSAVENVIQNKSELTVANNDVGKSYSIQEVENSGRKCNSLFGQLKNCQNSSKGASELIPVDNDEVSNFVVTHRDNALMAHLDGNALFKNTKIENTFENNTKSIKLVNGVCNPLSVTNSRQYQKVENEKPVEEENRNYSSLMNDTTSVIGTELLKDNFESNKATSNYTKQIDDTCSGFREDHLSNSTLRPENAMQSLCMKTEVNITDDSSKTPNFSDEKMKFESSKNTASNGKVNNIGDINRPSMTKVTYIKDKLLATMKAIDDSEDIESFEEQNFHKQDLLRI